MAKIKVRLAEGEGRLISITDEGGELMIETPARPIDGSLVIGAYSVRHERGVSRIDPKLLADGIYKPSLVTKSGVFRLPEVEIHRGEIRIRRTLEETTEGINERMKAITAELDELGATLSSIRGLLKTTIM